jgi:tripartite-type tricarboxylate transporter receptor subunit TctC
MTLLPDVPTVAESYPGFDVQAWTGFAAPAGTPREPLERLTTEIRAILQSTEMRRRLVELGVEPGGVAPAAFARQIDDTYVTFGKVIQAAGIKPE